jgi:hypothetical protein
MDLLLTKDDEGGLTVRIGDRWADHLGSDEALWCVVEFLTGREAPRYLQTAEQHAAWEARYCPKPLAAWQKQLAPVTSEQEVHGD